jgi:hypothetical protein
MCKFSQAGSGYKVFKKVLHKFIYGKKGWKNTGPDPRKHEALILN